MSTFYVHRRTLGKVRKYVPTDKEMQFGANDKEQVWWRFAEMIREKFGDDGATPDEIYNDMAGPMGLTADTTMELLYKSRDAGYLKVV